MCASRTVDPEVALDRSRVVESALAGLLDATQLEAAMTIWQQDFAGHASFPFVAFSDAVSRRVAGAPGAGAVMEALARNTRKPGGSRQRNTPSASAARASAPPSRSGSAPSTDALVVFNALAAGLVQRIDEELRGELREYMQTSVSAIGLSADGVALVRPWCASIDRGVQPLEVMPPLGDLRATLHHIYVWLCEGDGPVATDRLFNAVIRVVERMPEARRFPPRRLL